MPVDQRDAGYLWDMLQAARGVVQSISSLTIEQYRADENLRLAVEQGSRSSARLPAGFRQAFSRPILRFRGAVSSGNGTSWHTNTARSTMS